MVDGDGRGARARAVTTEVGVPAPKGRNNVELALGDEVLDGEEKTETDGKKGSP